MNSTTLVDLSRLQFAATAMYHFLFVPLTLGLSILLAIMESIFVMTGRTIWRDMTRFWGILFGINFAMGVATGITMEFQFGTNWAYYSHYVGDIFGVPLAIEGLMAFFLEGTFIGLFFFGWDRLSRGQHLIVTWLVAIGSNLSALWILIANAWMQNPVGAHFNSSTMRMELDSIRDVIFNPVAQSKFVHTVSAGYVTGAVFVLAVSAWYLLKGRHIDLAKRSATVAIGFGLAAALSVVVLGDESGYSVTEHQKMKLAAIESEWHTEPAPAPFTVFGIPDMSSRETHARVQVPWMFGSDRNAIGRQGSSRESLNSSRMPSSASSTESPQARHSERCGRIPMISRPERRSRSMPRISAMPCCCASTSMIRRRQRPAQIDQAAWDTVPSVAPIFWTFRVMVALGFFFIALFAVGFYLAARRRIAKAGCS